MKQRGLTYATLAERVGSNTRRVSLQIRGREPILPWERARLAEVLGVEVQELVNHMNKQVFQDD